LTSKLKPILLEVNHTPSFSTDSPLDFNIKSNLILDTLNILTFGKKNESRLDAQEVLNYENTHLGGFTRIYPTDDVKKILSKIKYNKVF
jgi:tubulin polyglutamylase TTLL6/13